MTKNNQSEAFLQPLSAAAAPGGTAELSLIWPPFLDTLSYDPKVAMEALYGFIRKLFRTYPPRTLRWLPAADREDVLHNVIIHCCKDDFRVLRTYRSRGKAFSHWLRCVADRVILAEIARRSVRLESIDELPADFAPHPPESRLAAAIDGRRVLSATMRCIQQMDRESQFLLMAAATGATPRQMTRLLGWPASENKRVSDKCRYSRKKLIAMLQKAGVDVSAAGLEL